ncbi:TetR/AcrR family transcriptional regulator [Actinokineospora soli]
MDGRATRWAGQRERRRREFVDAALRAIAEHGPDVTTEQIAHVAGVARPQLYKHFADTADLQSAIADRAVEQVVAELAPLLDLRGTPMQMINEAIGSHVAWLVDNSNLYQYLNARSSTAGKRAITDVKTAVATHVTTLFEFYLGAFGVDKRPAEPLAFGVVGMVETTTARWVTNPRDLSQAAVADLLAHWVWRLVDEALRAGGVELDPHAPLDFAFQG